MDRLTFAIEAGTITLPETGVIAVLGPPADYDLSVLPKERVVVVTTFKPDHDAFEAAGYAVDVILPEKPALVIVVAGRARALNRGFVAQAALSGAALVVDGAKDAGVDSLYKDLKKRTAVSPAVAKAHGKVFAVEAGADLLDWLPEAQSVDGFRTWPGVFSADGIDPASRLLADALPPLKGAVADLGAGWGYLASRVLANSPGVTTLELVEAEANSLTCARENVTDPRARFRWADVRNWEPFANCDAIVCNPPFHTGRAADPALGRAFIAAAARALAPKGGLWLVANRQLPYEATLNDRFQSVKELPGSGAFKLFHATHPRRQER